MKSNDAGSLARLSTLQKLAVQQEDAAARQLAEALARLAQADDRCTELCHYEQEYLASEPRAGSVAALRQHSGFVAKLREAVRFQTDRVSTLAAEAECARQRWIGLHREVEKLEALEANVREALQHEAARAAGREADERGRIGWLRQQAVEQ